MVDDEARVGFNHNYAYHRYLLHQVPSGGDRARDASVDQRATVAGQIHNSKRIS
jgi:hypothetical protein